MDSGVVQLVVEDCDLEWMAAKSVCAMTMLVKFVRPVLLAVCAEEEGLVHLNGHVSVNGHAKGHVLRVALGHDCVNEQHRSESILSDSAEEPVGARDYGPSTHFDE
jgi:hypothetical protein